MTDDLSQRLDECAKMQDDLKQQMFKYKADSWSFQVTDSSIECYNIHFPSIIFERNYIKKDAVEQMRNNLEHCRQFGSIYTKPVSIDTQYGPITEMERVIVQLYSRLRNIYNVILLSQTEEENTEINTNIDNYFTKEKLMELLELMDENTN